MTGTALTPLDFDTAQKARDEVLGAVKGLLASLALIEGRIQPNTFEQMRRTVGLAIGNLEVDYLRHIFVIHPELDDVANP